MTETAVASETYGLVDDVLSTPELKTPPAKADAHRSTIIGVTREDADTGSTGIKFTFESNDVPSLNVDYVLWMPKSFVADIHVDPNTLPSEEGNNQKMQYTLGIANSTKDATLQQLRRFAYEQQRTLEGTTAPTTFDEFVSTLNSLLNGVVVVFVRQPDKKNPDPRFQNKLKITRFASIDSVNNPKAHKNVKKMWLEQTTE